MNWEIRQGDSLAVLRDIAPESVDAIVSDPPAGIAFMGKEWDGDKGGRDAWIAWLRDIMIEALRVLKPGGHALVWALPRTSHWTATAVEDAGFEIRDVGVHLFGTGFPKSLDVSKAINKAAGHWRGRAGDVTIRDQPAKGAEYERTAKGDPVTPDAAQWSGWGSALKPAAEHWILARKPLIGTVAKNVLAHGTGALNIDACRIGTDTVGWAGGGRTAAGATFSSATCGLASGEARPQVGRWPASVTLDEEAAAVLDEQSGERRGGGGASRFFYVAKGSRSEKTAGGDIANTHPTVKSIALMRWLVRLITPPGGLVLDMFAGSGTTGVACLAEGCRFVGIERDPAYSDIATQRIRHAEATRGES